MNLPEKLIVHVWSEQLGTWEYIAQFDQPFIEQVTEPFLLFWTRRVNIYQHRLSWVRDVVATVVEWSRGRPGWRYRVVHRGAVIWDRMWTGDIVEYFDRLDVWDEAKLRAI